MQENASYVWSMSAEQERPWKGNLVFPFTYSKAPTSLCLPLYRNEMDWNHSELSVHHSSEATGKAARCQQRGDGFSFNWALCSGKSKQADVLVRWHCASCMSLGPPYVQTILLWLLCLGVREWWKTEGEHQSLKSDLVFFFELINSCIPNSARCRYQWRSLTNVLMLLIFALLNTYNWSGTHCLM